MEKKDDNWSDGLRSCVRGRWSRLDIPGGLSRLIRELSWDKTDGRGDEDVITTEIFQLLDYLPRQEYLASVWNAFHDIREPFSGAFSKYADSARIITLPGAFDCGAKGHSEVQPDVLIESNTCVVSVEAKRFGLNRFHPTQLARQALLLERIAEGRDAFLWVILDSPPPIKLGKFGSQTLTDALEFGLRQISGSDSYEITLANFEKRLGWVTWNEIIQTCREQRSRLEKSGIANECSDRIIAAMETACAWHRRG